MSGLCIKNSGTGVGFRADAFVNKPDINGKPAA